MFCYIYHTVFQSILEFLRDNIKKNERRNKQKYPEQFDHFLETKPVLNIFTLTLTKYISKKHNKYYNTFKRRNFETPLSPGKSPLSFST